MRVQKRAAFSLSFLCGGITLMLELAASRLLGPYFGNSIIVWTSLIVVTLGALSIGYAAGGALSPSDRFAGDILPGLLALNGLGLLFLPVFESQVLVACSLLPLGSGSLVASACVISGPLVALAMSGPVLLRRLVELGDVRASTASGVLSALNALGSVLFALMTSHFLVPFIGIASTMQLAGLALLLVAAGLRLYAPVSVHSGRDKAMTLLLAAILFGCAGGPFLRRANTGDRVIDSQYATVCLQTTAGEHRLLLDRVPQTVIDLRTGKSRLEYTDCVLRVARMVPRSSGNALLLGLGGGVIAAELAALGWSVDAVEIDPVVVAIAEQEFLLDRELVDVFVDDARRYAARAAEQYDIIVVDAYGGGQVPFHLLTQEFWALLKGRRSSQGATIINAITDGIDGEFAVALQDTLATVEENVFFVPATPAGAVQNIVFVGSSVELPLPRHPAERAGPASSRPVLFSDDRNPSDILLRPVQEGIHVVLRPDE